MNQNIVKLNGSSQLINRNLNIQTNQGRPEHNLERLYMSNNHFILV